MVKVGIWGKASSVTKQEQRYAISWFLNELVGTRLASNITVSVSNLPRKEHEGQLTYGEATWDFDTDLPRQKPIRKFRIHINPVLTRAKSLQTLAHELTHVEQVARGRLKDLGYKSNRSRRWKNKRYDPNDKDGYDTFPWEIEARAKEVVLWDRYSAHLEMMNLSFGNLSS